MDSINEFAFCLSYQFIKPQVNSYTQKKIPQTRRRLEKHTPSSSAERTYLPEIGTIYGLPEIINTYLICK